MKTLNLFVSNSILLRKIFSFVMIRIYCWIIGLRNGLLVKLEDSGGKSFRSVLPSTPCELLCFLPSSIFCVLMAAISLLYTGYHSQGPVRALTWTVRPLGK